MSCSSAGGVVHITLTGQNYSCKNLKVNIALQLLHDSTINLQQQQQPFYGHYMYTCQPVLAGSLGCGGRCWSKVLLPTCPYWLHIVHSDWGENAQVLIGVTYTVSIPIDHYLTSALLSSTWH